MDRKRTLRRRFRQATAALALVTVSAPACMAPPVEAPRLLYVPKDFWHAPGEGSSRVFPNRIVLDQGAWFGDIRAMEPKSDIYVTTYEGYATMGEAQAARDAQAARYASPTGADFGQVAEVTINGRPAFTWLVTRYNEFGAVRAMDYKAVLPYDSMTYVVEFMTSFEGRLHPDSLTSVVHSWGVPETGVPRNVVFGLGAVMAGLMLFVVVRLMRPRHDTAYRMWRPGPDPKYPTNDPPTSSDGGP